MVFKGTHIPISFQVNDKLYLRTLYFQLKIKQRSCKLIIIGKICQEGKKWSSV